MKPVQDAKDQQDAQVSYFVNFLMYTYVPKLKFTNLKKMLKSMVNLDIHFFIISILFIIWT